MSEKLDTTNEAEVATEASIPTEEVKPYKNKKKIAIIIGVAIVLIAAAVIVIVILNSSNGSAASKDLGWSRKIEVGNTVKLGSYEQDNNTSNGKESIEWTVVAVEDNKVLLISKYALDCQKFNSSSKQGNEWETSELKTWLEGTFTSSAFSEKEQSYFDGFPFCMTVDEVNTYLPTNEDRVCLATDYAIAQGVAVTDGACYWWLSSPGHRAYASFVKPDGTVIAPGFRVNYESYAVRPALWVNLNK